MLYAEPGGYYEHGVDFGKPVVACVVGRWKSKLTRAVGHAGAMAGSGDTRRGQGTLVHGGVRRRRPVHARATRYVSAKGAVVTNIAHIPAALTAVMTLNGIAPDFAPAATSRSSPGSPTTRGSRCRPTSRCPPSTALPPYDAQIAALGQQVGAVIPRQNMKDKSGATVMDPRTQVTSVHGHSVLDLAMQPLEANFALPLVHEIATARTTARCSTSPSLPR